VTKRVAIYTELGRGNKSGENKGLQNVGIIPFIKTLPTLLYSILYGGECTWKKISFQQYFCSSR
jgi:hypothetical protein